MKPIGMIIVFILFSCSTKVSSITCKYSNFPDKTFQFEDCFGKTLNDIGICFQWTIEPLGENKILYSVDGRQTCRRLICSLKENNQTYEVVFEEYGEGDAHYVPQEKKGDIIFRIKKKNEKYFAYNLESPESGEMMTNEYELKASPQN